MDFAPQLVVQGVLGLLLGAWLIRAGRARTGFLGAVATAIRTLGLRPAPDDLLAVHGNGIRLRFRGGAIEITTQGGPALGFALAPRSATADGTGDPAFDAVVTVSGADRLRALAVLDGETRGAVAEAVSIGATFDGRQFRWRVEEDPRVNGQRIVAGVRAILRADRRLNARASVSDDEALEDRCEEVALRAVDLFHRARRLEEVRARVSRASPAVRARVALHTEDWASLREMLAKRGRVAARAALALVERGVAADPGLLEAALIGGLADPRDAEAAQDALVRVGSARALAVLRASGARDAARALAERLSTQAGSLALAHAGALALSRE